MVLKLFRLFEWIFVANSFVPIDKRPVIEGNVIVRLVFQKWEAIYSMSIPTIKKYIVLNDYIYIYIYIYIYTHKSS